MPKAARQEAVAAGRERSIWLGTQQRVPHHYFLFVKVKVISRSIAKKFFMLLLMLAKQSSKASMIRADIEVACTGNYRFFH